MEQSRSPKPLVWFVGGAALGALALYFLDPSRGKRRRALVRDQVLSKGRFLRRSTQGISKNLKNRFYGALAAMESRRHPKHLDDEALNQRVRSEFGRQIKHAKSVHTSVLDGVVTLSGPILADEVHKLLRCVYRVNGVREVINHLDIRDSAEGISGLQGSGPQYLQ